jgi:hypothetical protein
MATGEQWSKGLQGMGAWFNSQGPQYMAAQARQQEAQTLDALRQEKLSDEREMAWKMDNRKLLYHMNNKNYGAATELLSNRRGDIVQLGGDTTHTDNQFEMMGRGQYDELRQGVKTMDDVAVLEGLDPYPKKAGDKYLGKDGGQAIFMGEDGNPYATKIPGFDAAAKAGGKDKGYQFENPKLFKEGGDLFWKGVRQNPNTGESEPYSVKVGSAEGMQIVQSSTGQTPTERPLQIKKEATARAEGTAGVKLKMEPETQRRVATAKAEVSDMFKVAAGNRDKSKTYQVYQAAMGRMTDAFGLAFTGPGMDWLPLVTANRQKVVATINVMRPIIKKAIRGPGEGPFTDNDQAVLDGMMPTLGDHDEVVAFKIGLINNYMAGEAAPLSPVTAESIGQTTGPTPTGRRLKYNPASGRLE